MRQATGRGVGGGVSVSGGDYLDGFHRILPTFSEHTRR